MRAARRRERKTDLLASPDVVRGVLSALRSVLPDIIPPRDKELVRMLRAARHVQRYPATDTKRGRPSRWRREDLLKVAARLADILDRETSSRTSLASFVDHYLRLLHFTADVTTALSNNEINLFEAEQLARVTEKRLGVTPAEARRTRTDLLASHLQTKASGERLRRRVNELLSTSLVEVEALSTSENLAQEWQDLEDFDPYDPAHLFWDQLKQLGFAFREISRDEVTEQEVEELLKASEPVMAIVARIQRRKGQTQASKLKL
jgi:hypothetical protein